MSARPGVFGKPLQDDRTSPMENATYIALSRQSGLRRQMEVVANNIANMDTPGFKAQRLMFQQYLSGSDTPGGQGEVSMVIDQASLRDMAPGALNRTGNQLDVAIMGEGYLVVDTPAGPRYTRNGRLGVDTEGRLIDINGYAVMDQQNRPIDLPRFDEQVTISANGDIATSEGQVGTIRLVQFDNESAMAPLGGGLLVTNEVPKEAEDTTLAQGMLEQSNVVPIMEMTRMIHVSRSYKSVQKLIDTEHERQRTAIRELGKAPS